VRACKDSLERILVEAKAATLRIETCAAGIDKLTATRSGGGKGGGFASLHKRLQDHHLVAIVVDHPASALTLLGTPDMVARVAKILEDELDVEEHSRVVGERLIPVIIGRGGTNIKKLQADTGAVIDLDRSGGRVTVRGRKAQVALAVAKLDELLEGNGEKEVRVSQRQVPLLIGRGGGTIRQLQEDSGAQIDVRKDESLVRIRGNQKQVEDAVRLIEAVLAESAPLKPPAANGTAPTTSGAPPPGLSKTPGPPARGPPPGLSK